MGWFYPYFPMKKHLDATLCKVTSSKQQSWNEGMKKWRRKGKREEEKKNPAE